MKPEQAPKTNSHDISAMRHTLLTLTASHKIVSTVIVAIVAIVWWSILNQLLDYGRHLDYNGLESLGPQVVQFLQRYNPFFWWGLVIICTLIIIYLLTGFIQGSARRNQRKLVPANTFKHLNRQLSAPAKEVLLWVWHDRRQPVTVGDLQQALKEFRAGRAGKIALARQHAAIIDEKQAITPRSEVEHHLRDN